jgi:hypothetical protein
MEELAEKGKIVGFIQEMIVAYKNQFAKPADWPRLSRELEHNDKYVENFFHEIGIEQYMLDILSLDHLALLG